MVLEKDSLSLLSDGLLKLEETFDGMPGFEVKTNLEQMREVLLRTAERMQDNYPYPHPLYAGQMLKPPHPIARLAYMLSIWINPNNHALDGGRASSAMEKEAVANIARMCGWSDAHLGHLTGGGTMANLEALWIAGKLHPGKTIVASSQAHYTHARVTEVLGLPFHSIASDAKFRMDLNALEDKLKNGTIGTVVVTLGTTGTGSVDPLPLILSLREKYGFRVHVDAAYGGYFKLTELLEADTRASYECMHQADSIVIDPHKHGLQPYGCGCVLFQDPSVGSIYKHDSPYTYFSSDELHLGEISLECSRAGASAVALWATQQLLPMEKGGEFAAGLEKSRRAALQLYNKLDADPSERTLLAPELDIVIWAPQEIATGGTAAPLASEISARSQQVFTDAAARQLHLALIRLPADLLRRRWPDVQYDQATVSCLRSCLMKPEHWEWIDRIWQILKSVR